MPHYYIATFVGFTGKMNNVWNFENFIDQQTNAVIKKKSIKAMHKCIKHFGLLHQAIEEYLKK